MKTRIYFVRHGECHSNVDPFFAGEIDGLTELGQRQAKAVATRFKDIPVDISLVSTIPRAIQTAEEIKQVTGSMFTELDFLRERRGAFEALWLHRDLSGDKLSEKMISVTGNPGWKPGTDETFEELKERAQKTKTYLENLKPGHVVVVSHSMFMRIFAAYIVLGEEMSVGDCVGFMTKLSINNTGISVFDYDAEAPDWRQWRLDTWNDKIHLS